MVFYEHILRLRSGGRTLQTGGIDERHQRA
jgi:hypothetical protein